MKITQFYNVPVIHCKDSFGLIIQHKSQWKIVFSGDTRPSKELIEAGKDCTLLIHEATFEDDLIQDALEKSHSTTSEAIESGMEMNSYRIILNHFSQRYPKIPVFNSNYNEKTCISFDMMRIDFVDLKNISKLIPLLQNVFPKEEESEDEQEEQKKKGKIKNEKNKKQ